MSGRDTFGAEVVVTRRANRMNRLYALLTPNASIPVQRILGVLDCSLATFKRDLDFLRSVKKLVIAWDGNGYRLIDRPREAK